MENDDDNDSNINNNNDNTFVYDKCYNPKEVYI